MLQSRQSLTKLVLSLFFVMVPACFHVEGVTQSAQVVRQSPVAPALGTRATSAVQVAPVPRAVRSTGPALGSDAIPKGGDAAAKPPPVGNTLLPNGQPLVRGSGCSSDARRDFARARQLAAAGKWAESIAFYDVALRRRPFDAAMRGERGLALYHTGDFGGARDDLQTASALTQDRGILGAVYFNLGLTFSALNQPNEARLSYSSAASRGNSAAKKRLLGQNACRATWEILSEGAPAPLANNLRQLLDARREHSCRSIGFAKTEAQASALLCRPCDASDSAPECSAEFPLEVREGGDSFSEMRFEAERLEGNRPAYFYFLEASSSSDPRPKWRVEADLLIVEEVRAEEEILSDGQGNQLFEDSAPVYRIENLAVVSEGETDSCQPNSFECPVSISNGTGALRGCGIRTNIQNYVTLYSMKTRRAVMTITAFDGMPEVHVRRGRVEISGLECEAQVSLPSD